MTHGKCLQLIKQLAPLNSFVWLQQKKLASFMVCVSLAGFRALTAGKGREQELLAPGHNSTVMLLLITAPMHRLVVKHIWRQARQKAHTRLELVKWQLSGRTV
jgi:hypothetical protein